jgi:NlpC/P60 family
MQGAGVAERVSVVGGDQPYFPHLAGPELRECDAVAATSLGFLGRGYRITRELVRDLMDCSTVVSQAHWDGAAIQTPFIAETQRLASNAVDVVEDDLLPGDAIYTYPSRHEAPGGRHNHVVLYLGPDDRGTRWTIQSSNESGVVLTELAKVRSDGGIRRFCQNPRTVFPQGEWSSLVALVPKLGRLGSRLIARYGPVQRHRGTDLYIELQWTIVSPVSGTIVGMAGSLGSNVFVELWSPADCLFVRLGPINPAPRLRCGRDVGRGDLLGGPGRGFAFGPCNVAPGKAGKCRLHWELWCPQEFGMSPATELRVDRTFPGLPNPAHLMAHNAIYAVKLGLVGSCVVW